MRGRFGRQGWCRATDILRVRPVTIDSQDGDESREGRRRGEWRGRLSLKVPVRCWSRPYESAEACETWESSERAPNEVEFMIFERSREGEVFGNGDGTEGKERKRWNIPSARQQCHGL